MSSEVFFEVVRKSDSMPWDKIYLGGNRMEKSLPKIKFEATVMGREAKDKLLELEKTSVLPKHPQRGKAEELLIKLNRIHLQDA